MNIRRGLFRLWIVLALAWVGAMVVLWFSEGAKGDPPVILVIMLGPPIALLGLGWGVMWAISGFSEPPSSN
jgi:hypothetical protein